jgi:phosphate transport system substrate-binding protein
MIGLFFMWSKLFVLFTIAFFLVGGRTSAREKILIVGSSAVLPYVHSVAENFTSRGEYRAPCVETTGTGRGFRLFCGGVGFEYPDIIATVRPITDAEIEDCRKCGVSEIIEIVVGQDGLVVLNSNQEPQYDFSISDLFKALAAEVIRDKQVVRNTVKTWNAINPSLPNEPISILGPPVTSPYYDALLDMIMEKACRALPEIVSLEKARRYGLCRSLRKDGAFVNGTKYPSATIDWLRRHPKGFGIGPFSLLSHYDNAVGGNFINGISPSMVNITKGYYPLTRPVFLYVKRKHVESVTGLQHFLYEFTSERAVSPDGYLVQKGFIPLDDMGRNRARDLALSLETMSKGQ